MTIQDTAAIEALLWRLGKQMLYYHVEPISLVICGGSALNVLNIASRTTKDVDVLVIVEAGPNGFSLKYGEELPVAFVERVVAVGKDMGQDPDWLNMGPKDVLPFYGPPIGMTERWVKREYGPNLTAYFIHRLDQIHFKLLAAADTKANPRHMEDLKKRIKPTEDEIRIATEWLLKKANHDAGFRLKVKNAVREIGYEHIADLIQV
jgi:hypothetical protein